MSRFHIFKISLCAFLLLLLSPPCFAHNVRIFAWKDGDVIKTESKFSGGKAAKNVTVSVFEIDTENVILSGKTDQEGFFSFKVPKNLSTGLEIVVNAGNGHRGSWRFDLGKDDTHAINAPDSQTNHRDTHSSDVVTFTITKEELVELIDSNFEKKLAPIRRILAENAEEKPSLQDILGGIGYILGLAGLAAYMNSRKTKTDRG